MMMNNASYETGVVQGGAGRRFAIAQRFIAQALSLQESRIRADPRRLRAGAGHLLSLNLENSPNSAHSQVASLRE